MFFFSSLSNHEFSTQRFYVYNNSSVICLKKIQWHQTEFPPLNDCTNGYVTNFADFFHVSKFLIVNPNIIMSNKTYHVAHFK